MKSNSVQGRAFLLLCSLLFIFRFSSAVAQSPTHTARIIGTIDPNINGYWEYLPRDYISDPEKRFPLIIFMHGYGESGAVADQATLNKVLQSSIPRMIENKSFPEGVTVSGITHRFIVLSPQIRDGINEPEPTSTISPATIDAMINFAVANYKVDRSRVYLCGLSMGGGGILDYIGSSELAAGKVAAVAIACPAADLSDEEASVAGLARIPLVLSHNIGDRLVLQNRSLASMENLVDKLPTHGNDPITAYFSVASPDEDNHNAWTRTFEHLSPGSTSDPNIINTLGMDIYQWLLRFTETSSPLPAVWKSIDLRQTTSGIFIEWAVTNQVNVKQYNIQRSNNGLDWQTIGSVTALPDEITPLSYNFTDILAVSGNTQYRVQMVDIDGRIHYSVVKSIRGLDAYAPGFAALPNPFVNDITISFEKQDAKNIKASLYNSTGLLITSKIVRLNDRAGNFTIKSYTTLSRGVYILFITDEAGNKLFNTQLLKE